MNRLLLYDLGLALGSCLIAIPIMYSCDGDIVVGLGIALGLTFSLMGIIRVIDMFRG
jgi:hypothetical protein